MVLGGWASGVLGGQGVGEKEGFTMGSSSHIAIDEKLFMDKYRLARWALLTLTLLSAAGR
jgi:hypothetical protein